MELERTVHGGHAVVVVVVDVFRFVGAHVEPVGRNFSAVFVPTDRGLGFSLGGADGGESYVGRAPGDVRLQFGDEFRSVVYGQKDGSRLTGAQFVGSLAPVAAFAAQVYGLDGVFVTGGQNRGAGRRVGRVEFAPPFVLRSRPAGRRRGARQSDSRAFGGHGSVGRDPGRAGPVTDQQGERRVADAVYSLPGQRGRRRVQHVDGPAGVHAAGVRGDFGYVEFVAGLPEVRAALPDPFDGHRFRVGGDVTLDGDPFAFFGLVLFTGSRGRDGHLRRILDVQHEFGLTRLSQPVVCHARVRARVLGSDFLDDVRERRGDEPVVAHPPDVVDARFGVHVALQRDGIVALDAQRIFRSDLDAWVI